MDMGLNEASSTDALQTRPDAIAPSDAAKKNGVSTEDRPNTRSAARWARGSSATCRNAKNAPRKTRPTKDSAKWGSRLVNIASKRRTSSDYNRNHAILQHPAATHNISAL